jgi:hypothetical protein
MPNKKKRKLKWGELGELGRSYFKDEDFDCRCDLSKRNVQKESFGFRIDVEFAYEEIPLLHKPTTTLMPITDKNGIKKRLNPNCGRKDITFEVSLKINDETVNESMTAKEVHVSSSLDQRRYMVLRFAADTKKHIKEFFAGEVKRTFSALFEEGKITGLGGEVREFFINARREEEVKQMRQRLKRERGRPMGNEHENYYDDKKKFIIECVEVLKNLQNEGKKLTQQNLADAYFTDRFRADQKKPLLKKLKLYEISWKELLAKIPNNLG